MKLELEAAAHDWQAETLLENQFPRGKSVFPAAGKAAGSRDTG